MVEAAQNQKSYGGISLMDQKYWLRKLSDDWSISRFPSDYRHSVSIAPEQNRHAFDLSSQLSSKIMHLCNASDMAAFVVMLSAVQFILYKYTGSQDISVGTPTFHKEYELGQNYALVLRNQLESSKTFKQFLLDIKDTVKEGVIHQNIHFKRVAELLQMESNHEGEPILHTAIMLNRLQQERHLTQMNSEMAFVFNIEEETKLISCQIEYQKARFEANTVRRISKHLTRFLDTVTADPDILLSDIHILDQAENELMLYGFNETEASFSTNKTMHQLFEMQADLTPHAIALYFEGQSITYQELNERANRLADLLASRGVGPGIYTALMLDRSVNMVVAMMGILKAGGAYVPLEPSFPKVRIEQMLRSLHVSVAVTESKYLPSIYDLLWKLSDLKEMVCLDAETAEPPVEVLDTQKVSELWDLVSENADNRESAGGFVSSYTRELFTPKEVDHYRDYVVQMIEPHINRESRILEIGCGAGLIMHEIAPRVKHFTGVDPSAKTQAHNQLWVEEQDYEHVHLIQGFADEMMTMEAESMDVVIIASTAQFFPGHLYFQQTIEQALRLLSRNGVIILADLMDESRKVELKDSIAAYYEQHHPGIKPPGYDDGKLYCDAKFFTFIQNRYKQLEKVEILRRHSGFDNELKFRYDVLLHKGIEGESTVDSVNREGSHHIWTGWHLQYRNSSNFKSQVTSEDHAYVIFTSGSTGEPKGVIVKHKPVINLIEWVNRTYKVSSNDRILFITSICFDLSVYDLFGILAAGGGIHIASEDDVRDPVKLLHILCNEKITFWDSAPAAFGQLMPFIDRVEDQTLESSLRIIFLSGDWIPMSLPKAVETYFPKAQMIALGGATEATVWSNHFPITEIDPEWVSIPYGKPIQNARYYILDSDGHPCPIGVKGELYIGGQCLAEGYHDPQLTEQRFIPNPFLTMKNERLYLTGDTAKWMPDGNIEFMGRLDHQVKIRGYRIEMGEIQSKLLEHSAISEVIVLDREDTEGNKYLCAYYAASDSLTVSELREYIGGHLPSYMMPSYFVQLDSLPVTSNGKIDRKGLPEPAGHIHTGAEYEEPTNETEIQLVEIWKNLLEVERIGIQDNFFDLGGHSMMAIKLELEMEKANMIVERAAVYKCQTIKELAMVVDVDKEAAAAKG